MNAKSINKAYSLVLSACIITVVISRICNAETTQKSTESSSAPSHVEMQSVSTAAMSTYAKANLSQDSKKTSHATNSVVAPIISSITKTGVLSSTMQASIINSASTATSDVIKKEKANQLDHQSTAETIFIASCTLYAAFLAFLGVMITIMSGKGLPVWRSLGTGEKLLCLSPFVPIVIQALLLNSNTVQNQLVSFAFAVLIAIMFLLIWSTDKILDSVVIFDTITRKLIFQFKKTKDKQRFADDITNMLSEFLADKKNIYLCQFTSSLINEARRLSKRNYKQNIEQIDLIIDVLLKLVERPELENDAASQNYFIERLMELVQRHSLFSDDLQKSKKFLQDRLFPQAVTLYLRDNSLTAGRISAKLPLAARLAILLNNTSLVIYILENMPAHILYFAKKEFLAEIQQFTLGLVDLLDDLGKYENVAIGPAMEVFLAQFTSVLGEIDERKESNRNLIIHLRLISSFLINFGIQKQLNEKCITDLIAHDMKLAKRLPKELTYWLFDLSAFINKLSTMPQMPTAYKFSIESMVDTIQWPSRDMIEVDIREIWLNICRTFSEIFKSNGDLSPFIEPLKKTSIKDPSQMHYGYLINMLLNKKEMPLPFSDLVSDSRLAAVKENTRILWTDASGCNLDPGLFESTWELLLKQG